MSKRGNVKKFVAASLASSSLFASMPAVALADVEQEKVLPQGDATFAGAEFTVTNKTGDVCATAFKDGNNYVDVKEFKEGEVLENPIITNDDGEGFWSINNGNRLISVYSNESPTYKEGTGYEIKETKAPEGYELNPDGKLAFVANETAPQDKSLKTGATATVIYDKVIRGGLKITKIDHDLQRGQAQGSASLENAEFTIYNKSKNAVIVEGKKYEVGEAVLTVKTNKEGIAETSADALPYGTYQIKETKAPDGYLLNEEWNATVAVRNKAELVDVAKMASAAEEQVMIGGILLGKVDKDIWSTIKNAFVPQGDASLEDAEFAIVNLNENPVFVEGHEYQKGEIVKTVKTKQVDGKYVAATGLVLPKGKYEVYEANPSNGYKLTEKTDFDKVFDITENGQVLSFLDMDQSLPNEVIRGGLAIQKVDAITGEAKPLGSAELKGAEYSITNRSKNAVYVNEHWYQPGEVVMTLTTNETGYAATASDALPYGTYELKETKAPQGYVLDTEWTAIVEVRKLSEIVKTTHKEQIQLGNLGVAKRDFDSKPQGDNVE